MRGTSKYRISGQDSKAAPLNSSGFFPSGMPKSRLGGDDPKPGGTGRRGGQEFGGGIVFMLLSRNDAPFFPILSETMRKIGLFAYRQPPDSL